MQARLNRLLHAVWRPHPDARASSRPTELISVRAALLQAVEDCAGRPALKLQFRIRNARSHHDLWALRSDAYHLIALQHCQSIANQRIHPLLHLFEPWTAPQAVRRVCRAGRA